MLLPFPATRVQVWEPHSKHYEQERIHHAICRGSATHYRDRLRIVHPVLNPRVMKALTHNPIGADGGVFFTAKAETAQDVVTAGQIWNNVNAFVRAREKAYLAMMAQGVEVPDFARKQNAIKMLKHQLEASKQWSLVAQVRWINALRPMIATLLPIEHHKEQRLRTYRRRILHLLNYCESARFKIR